MRVALRVLGRQAHRAAAARPRARGAGPRCRPCSASGSARICADRHARVERGERVLEDDLHARGAARAARRHPACRGRCRRRRTRPAVGSISRSTSRPERATCRSPIRRPRPASRRRASVRSTPSTARTAPLTRPSSPRRTGKCLTRPCSCSSGAGAHAVPATPSRQQRVGVERRLPAAPTDGRRRASASGGAALRHCASANGQRAAKRQPAGMRSGLGTWPSMAARRRCSPCRRGIEPSRPDRVRVLRRGEQRAPRAPVRRPARRTSPPPRRPPRPPRPGRA